ncbi:MAG TPA: hypothetical protein VG347_20305 [Verrucomicrobiae bacterium]|nr:hypothetical protein [Verrucomicrobiae bacterium]
MKEQLLKLLKLPADAPDESVLKAVEKLQAENATLRSENDELLEAPAETPQSQLEKRIQRKIAESAGALNREQAIMAITHQDEATAKAKEAAKKAPKK